MEATPIVPQIGKAICWDHVTKDYAMYLDGQFVGYAANYHEAEVKLDALAWNILRHLACPIAPEELPGISFTELIDDEARELAWELWYHGDAETLDQAAGLALDMTAVIADCSAEWDEAVAFAREAAGVMLMDEGDMLDAEGMRV